MDFAEALNNGCLCSTLDPDRLRAQLEIDPVLAANAQEMLHSRPHLFSATTVFVSSATAATVEATVAAVERIARLPGYVSAALARAEPIARHAFGPSGAFMSFDFHLGPDGPRLIEINTNAGGAFLAAALARAQRACCEPMMPAGARPTDAGVPEDVFLAMFIAEWRRQRGDAPLRTVLIVDDAPAGQYLAPEFELARAMFARSGLRAAVADAADLEWRDGRLQHAGHPVDLVYNRLTDFQLAEPRHAALRAAYEAGAVVLTPHPRAHALYADKRNLVVLGDAARLAAWGAQAADIALLAEVVPHTEIVTAQRATELWAERRRLFFKPAAGYAAKAAYRGEKLTRRVWEEIVAGEFIAQALVPPAARVVAVDGTPTGLKFDLRAYAYDGRVQLLAARTYAGQTTNFRTPGGGFAPVVVLSQALETIP